MKIKELLPLKVYPFTSEALLRTEPITTANLCISGKKTELMPEFHQWHMSKFNI